MWGAGLAPGRQGSAGQDNGKYRKDRELAKRRNLPIEELNDVIYKLASDIPLPKEKKDHALRGNYVGYRECHIKPDWLLIYKKTDNNELQILELARTQNWDSFLFNVSSTNYSAQYQRFRRTDVTISSKSLSIYVSPLLNWVTRSPNYGLS